MNIFPKTPWSFVSARFLSVSHQPCPLGCISSSPIVSPPGSQEFRSGDLVFQLKLIAFKKEKHTTVSVGLVGWLPENQTKTIEFAHLPGFKAIYSGYDLLTTYRGAPCRWWFQTFFFNFHPGSLGRWSNLTNIFFNMGWNHQLVFLLKENPLIRSTAWQVRFLFLKEGIEG